MDLFKLRYLQVQTAVGGAVGTAVYFLSDEWWALALGIMAGAVLAFYRARKTLKNLDLPASATFGEYAEELRKSRTKRPKA